MGSGRRACVWGRDPTWEEEILGVFDAYWLLLDFSVCCSGETFNLCEKT